MKLSPRTRTQPLWTSIGAVKEVRRLETGAFREPAIAPAGMPARYRCRGFVYRLHSPASLPALRRLIRFNHSLQGDHPLTSIRLDEPHDRTICANAKTRRAGLGSLVQSQPTEHLKREGLRCGKSSEQGCFAFSQPAQPRLCHLGNGRGSGRCAIQSSPENPSWLLGAPGSQLPDLLVAQGGPNDLRAASRWWGNP